MPVLDEVTYLGRSNVGGPTAGFYISVNFGPIVLGSGEADFIGPAFHVAQRIRLMYLTLTSAVAAVANADVILKRNTTVTNTAATSLSATIALDGGTSLTAGYSGAEGSALVPAQRNVSQDQFIFPVFTTDGTGTLTSHNLTLFFFALDHVNREEAND
ncbi:MAG: hypothetical protein V3S43_06320 [Acidimicrobiia bacterium]